MTSSRPVHDATRCASCGATVHVVPGCAARCPFCGGWLAVGQGVARPLEPAGQSATALSWHAMAPALQPQEVTHLEALGRALGFQPEDLLAHRMGQWSRRDRLKRLGITAVVFAFFFIPLVVIAAFTTSSVERFAGVMAFMLPIPLLALAAIAFPALVGTVRPVDGIVRLSSRWETDDGIFIQGYVHVGGESFKVDQAAAVRIQDGRAYRLYISSSGEELVSMEPFPTRTGGA